MKAPRSVWETDTSGCLWCPMPHLLCPLSNGHSIPKSPTPSICCLSLAFSDVGTVARSFYQKGGHFISPGECSAHGVWYTSSNFSTPCSQADSLGGRSKPSGGPSRTGVQWLTAATSATHPGIGSSPFLTSSLLLPEIIQPAT